MDRKQLIRSKATFNGGTTPLSSKPPETKEHQSESATGHTTLTGSDADDDLDHPELENPAQAWVMLVEACHLKDKIKQKEQIQICLGMARTSKWTQQVLDQLDQDFYDSEEEPTVGWEEVGDSLTEHRSFRDEDDSQEPMWQRYQ